jgi:hypothetical protein
MVSSLATAPNGSPKEKARDIPPARSQTGHRFPGEKRSPKNRFMETLRWLLS